MRDIQTIDFNSTLDSTIHVLQDNPASASPAVAIALIERWEIVLEGTELFTTLSELKQAILNSETVGMSNHLHRLGDKVATFAEQMRIEGSNEMATRIEQISELLIHISQHSN